MMNVPGKLGFDQKMHEGKGKTSSAKNKAGVGFDQPSHGKGKNSSAKNKSVGFSQPSHGSAKASSKVNPGKVGFDQKNPAGKIVSTGIAGKDAKVGPAMGKGKANPKVGVPMPVPKGGFKSIDALTASRKKHYGA